MKGKLAGCICFVLMTLTVHAQKTDADIIIDRYKTFLFLTDTSNLPYQNIPAINAQGRWADIHYTDDQPGAWQLTTHMRRIKTLAMHWARKNSPAYHSAAVKNTISLALHDWFLHRYKSKNWWHNEIGIPQLMRDVIALMKDTLTAGELSQALQILAQHKVKGTGANLVWSADLGLHYGAFTGDMAMMKHCRDTILSVIKITTDEGVQPDYSFHQHGKRLQMYHYGGAFLLEDVRLAWQLSGLSIAFPPAKVQVLTDFVLQGWQWMARGINTVPGTIDRAASRRDALHSADIRKIIPLLYEVQPDSIRAFKKMLAIQQGESALGGYRYFPYADFTAFHQPGYSFFLKTNSTRTLLTESINDENQKGELLNSGDGYFISNGSEYYNLMPFWDWDRLPGITNFVSERKNKIRQQSFVGNVSNGSSGLAVMDYFLQKDSQSLHAKKFWASWKNVTVSLIAASGTNEVSAPAFTVLDQCRWQGDVTVNKEGNLLKEGIYHFSKLKWIHHSRFVYLPLYDDSIDLQLKNEAGRWSDINRSETSALMHDKVFMPSIIHKQNRNTGYVVAYAASAKQAAAIAAKPLWKVLENDSTCQAVSFHDATLMAAFYEAGERSLTKKLRINVSRACLLMVAGDTIFVSDPGHTGGNITVIINQNKYHVELPADGNTVALKAATALKCKSYIQ